LLSAKSSDPDETVVRGEEITGAPAFGVSGAA
jgi:hypothetical protein